MAKSRISPDYIEWVLKLNADQASLFYIVYPTMVSFFPMPQQLAWDLQYYGREK